MTDLQAALLGIVQGVTEFLPVSSSGHLVLLQKWFHLPSEALTFDIALHVGTLVAVLAAFWRDLLSLARRPGGVLMQRIVLSTAPTVAIGLLFADFFERMFHSGATLGLEFVITGTLLLWVESRDAAPLYADAGQMPYAGAWWIGVAQGAAILPALSRSGLTLAAGLGAGLDRPESVRYSFLLSVPVVLGAAILETVSVLSGTTPIVHMRPLVIGAGMSAVSGYAAIRFLLGVVRRATLRPFGYYALTLGVLVLMDQWIFHVAL